MQAQLADKNWALRLEAVGALDEAAAALPAERKGALQAELLLWRLQQQPGPAETNLKVQAKVLEALQHVAQGWALLPRRSAARLLALATEKLATKQTKPAATEALLAVAEACSAAWTFGKVRDAALAHKSPKVLAEALGWAREALEAFSLQALPARELADFALGALDARDPQVREQALQLLVALQRAVGPSLLSSPLLKPLKEAARKTLADAVAKLPLEQAGMPPPSRFFRHGPAPAATATAAAAAGSGGAALDELVPCVDLLKDKIKPATMAQLKSANWKERHAALGSILQLLKDHPRLAPGVSALLEALTQRLSDNQLVLCLGALEALGLLGAGLGRHARLHLRLAVAPVLHAFGDGKQQVRDAALKAADMWVAEASIEPLLPLVFKALTMESPAGRALLLTWLTRYVHNGLSCGHADVMPLLPLLLKGLDDRAKEVRAAAEAAAGALVGWGLPFAALEEPLSKLTPATATKLKVVLAKLQQCAREQPPQPQQSAAAAAAATAAAPPAKRPATAPPASLNSASMPSLASARGPAPAAKPKLAFAAAPAKPKPAESGAAPAAALAKPAADEPRSASTASARCQSPRAPPTPRSADKPSSAVSRLAAAVATLQSQKSGASQLQKAMAEVAEQLLDSSEALASKMPLLTAAVSERLKQCLLPAVIQDTQVSKALVTLALQLTKSAPLMAQLGEAEVQMLLLSLVEPMAQAIRLTDVANAEMLLSSFNIVTLQVLQNAPREVVVCAALRLMQERAKQRSQTDFVELLIKCVMKIVKTMRGGAHPPARPMLRQLHELFETLPPPAPAGATPREPATPGQAEAAEATSRVREAADVLLQEIVAHHPDAAAMLGEVVPLKPQPFILRRVLQLQGHGDSASPPASPPCTAHPEPVPPSSRPVAAASPAKPAAPTPSRPAARSPQQPPLEAPATLAATSSPRAAEKAPSPKAADPVMEGAMARLNSLRSKYQVAPGTPSQPAAAARTTPKHVGEALVPPSPSIDMKQLKKRLAVLKTRH